MLEKPTKTHESHFLNVIPWAMDFDKQESKTNN
jgi:hypothetical protein